MLWPTNNIGLLDLRSFIWLYSYKEPHHLSAGQCLTLSLPFISIALFRIVYLPIHHGICICHCLILVVNLYCSWKILDFYSQRMALLWESLQQDPLLNPQTSIIQHILHVINSIRSRKLDKLDKDIWKQARAFSLGVPILGSVLIVSCAEMPGKLDLLGDPVDLNSFFDQMIHVLEHSLCHNLFEVVRPTSHFGMALELPGQIPKGGSSLHLRMSVY